jgi:hypothetical protein
MSGLLPTNTIRCIRLCICVSPVGKGNSREALEKYQVAILKHTKPKITYNNDVIENALCV